MKDQLCIIPLLLSVALTSCAPANITTNANASNSAENFQGNFAIGPNNEMTLFQGDEPAATERRDYSTSTLARLFRAKGTHQCQSHTSIGHKCSVFGTNYTSCDEAQRKLAMSDCCPKTKDKGTSIDFQMGTCTAF